jgi:plasmid stability protein
MATLTIRNVPDQIRDTLRVRAAMNGRSLEAEIRKIIVEAVDGARPGPDEAEAAIEEIRTMIRASNRGKLPKGVVDAFLKERRHDWGEEA